MSNKENKSENFFVIITRNVIEKLCFDDILFFESRGRKVYVHTKDKACSFNGSLKGIREKLDERFFSCHGSFVVNLAQVVKLEGSTIQLEGGKAVPMSQRKKPETIRQIKAYLEKHFPCNSDADIV